MNSTFLPGDSVIWYNVRKGSLHTHKKVRATVYYKTKFRIAIRVKDILGNEVVKFVTEDQLEKDTVKQ